jgi:putative NADH-flavin reductase
VKLALFGATGKVGRELTSRALAQGHEVTALVRDPEKLGVTHAKLKLLKGDATKASDVSSVIQGQDAVLCALGPNKNSPKDILEQFTTHAIAAMKQHGVKRIVVVGGAGMRVPEDSQDFGTQAIGWMISKLIADAVKDKQKQYDLLRSSALNFVILRAPVITTSERKGKYTIGHPPMGFGAQITTADLSDAMLEMLTSDQHLGKAPAIRN